ncbi:folate-binding protein YgfZ [Stenotrophomonas sp. S48]|uniref:CAF17-like 4Fe-4S cluster assembly/insertion protein YgfZ n=1 Tax=unclassified Stenotrophomonas TaxID=196198 RepID=UPI0019015790|nr:MULTISPECIES: folate-binding protein YgfZ [unclassified Stenotrophomonas]MBK0027917.1 folate-binding protein YgfZ [Stenotrophomonas sp. S48]MBK0049035.1 folate-binding protein YgfZ [Stenotrophomonas sp. S49]
MPDNLPPAFVAYPHLPGHQLVSLQGADAAAFAHAQFSSDVTALPLLHWQWSAWLSAKGRTLAVFQLLRLAEDHVMLVLADGDADAIASQLQRFVFRRKVKVQAHTDLVVTGAFTAPEAASGAAIARAEGADWELDLGSDALPRTLRISAATADAESDPAAFAAAWRQADLRFGLPRLDASQREVWTPQQLGLDRLNGYSVKKGCYPGQEIVARTHFLGKAKRAVQLLHTAAPAQAGEAVQQGGAALGTIASVAGNLALAVLPLETSDGELQVGGVAAQRVPLLDGLAR